MENKSQLDMYIEHQREFLKDYEGQIIAVKNGEVMGVYSSKTEAFDTMIKQYTPGDFIIIKCTKDDKEYTRRFHSRAIFGPAEAHI
jgi:hypothetical protein